MKGLLEEYGIIIVVVAIILLMLLFGKTGYAKSIPDAILGSANHIVETGENITKKEINVKTGDVLMIEGNNYIVLEKKSSDNYLVMDSEGIQGYPFQSMNGFDFQNINTYAGCEIDTYLKNKA